MVNKRQFTKRTIQDGSALADWLNDKEVPAAARDRVAAIARDLAVLSASAEPVLVRWPDKKSWAALKASDIPRDTPLTDDRVQALFKNWEIQETDERRFDYSAYARAAEALRRYAFRPHINIVRRARSIQAFAAQLVPDGWSRLPTVREAESGNWPTLADKKRGDVKEQEAWMVLLLMGLSSAGAVARLRECGCGNWFYARRPEKRHCSEPCRKGAYRPSAEQKENRQEYMREYMRAYNREKFPSRRPKSSKNKPTLKTTKKERR